MSITPGAAGAGAGMKVAMKKWTELQTVVRARVAGNIALLIVALAIAVAFYPAAWVVAQGPASSGTPTVGPTTRPAAIAGASGGEDSDEPVSIGNIFKDAIDFAQKRCVKIYGAGIAMEHGYATGIIVSPDGLILTAQGIIVASPSLKVVFPDGRIVAGQTPEGKPRVEIIRRSEALQSVILKVDAHTSDFFDLPDRPIVQKDDWVVAVGNWFKVAEGTEKLSAILGVVSLRAALDTKRRMQDVNLDCEVLLVDAITANPGAPGGALMTADGRLAGMIGKIVESKATNTRINYAIPADLLKAFIEGREPVPVPIHPAGEVPGALGIKLFLLAGKQNPAFIDSVVPDSPADKAGLKKDDMVLRVGAEYVRNCKEYLEQAAKLKAGVAVTIIVKRKDEVLQLQLTPAAVEPEHKPNQQGKPDDKPQP
jgi:serine protease Do